MRIILYTDYRVERCRNSALIRNVTRGHVIMHIGFSTVYRECILYTCNILDSAELFCETVAVAGIYFRGFYSKLCRLTK